MSASTKKERLTLAQIANQLNELERSLPVSSINGARATFEMALKTLLAAIENPSDLIIQTEEEQAKIDDISGRARCLAGTYSNIDKGKKQDRLNRGIRRLLIAEQKGKLSPSGHFYLAEHYNSQAPEEGHAYNSQSHTQRRLEILRHYYHASQDSTTPNLFTKNATLILAGYIGVSVADDKSEAGTETRNIKIHYEAKVKQLEKIITYEKELKDYQEKMDKYQSAKKRNEQRPLYLKEMAEKLKDITQDFEEKRIKPMFNSLNAYILKAKAEKNRTIQKDGHALELQRAWNEVLSTINLLLSDEVHESVFKKINTLIRQFEKKIEQSIIDIYPLKIIPEALQSKREFKEKLTNFRTSISDLLTSSEEILAIYQTYEKTIPTTIPNKPSPPREPEGYTSYLLGSRISIPVKLTEQLGKLQHSENGDRKRPFPDILKSESGIKNILSAQRAVPQLLPSEESAAKEYFPKGFKQTPEITLLLGVAHRLEKSSDIEIKRIKDELQHNKIHALKNILSKPKENISDLPHLETYLKKDVLFEIIERLSDKHERKKEDEENLINIMSKLLSIYPSASIEKNEAIVMTPIEFAEQKNVPQDVIQILSKYADNVYTNQDDARLLKQIGRKDQLFFQETSSTFAQLDRAKHELNQIIQERESTDKSHHHIEYARKYINIALTRAYAKAIAIKYGLVDGHNQSRVAALADVTLSLGAALVPVPGATLVAKALVMGAKAATSYMITKGALKLTEKRDIKAHSKRLGDIETMPQAASRIEAIEEALIFSYQHVFKNLNPTSLDRFVDKIIKRMFYQYKYAEEQLGEHKYLLHQQLVSNYHPKEFPAENLALSDEKKFEYMIQNMILGISLLQEKEISKTGPLTTIAESATYLSNREGHIAKAAQFIGAVTVLDIYGREFSVQSICTNPYGITWIGSNDSETAEAMFYKCGPRETKENTALDHMPLFMNAATCKARGFITREEATTKIFALPPEFSLTPDQAKIIALKQELKAGKEREAEKDLRIIQLEAALAKQEEPLTPTNRVVSSQITQPSHLSATLNPKEEKQSAASQDEQTLLPLETGRMRSHSFTSLKAKFKPIDEDTSTQLSLSKPRGKEIMSSQTLVAPAQSGLFFKSASGDKLTPQTTPTPTHGSVLSRVKELNSLTSKPPTETRKRG